MDNHGSHITLDFIEFCWEKRIIPYCFIPHTTHACQPLDDIPFANLKHYYHQYNNDVSFWGGDAKSKATFFDGIHNVRMQAFRPRSIRHGFRETGIWPVNSDKGLEKMGMATDDNDLPDMPGFIIHDIKPGWDRDHTTPPPPSSSLPNTPPQTVQKLRKGSNKVVKHIRNDPTISPKIRDGLIMILEGGLLLAEAGAQFQQDNVRILQRKKEVDTGKTKRRLPKLGPRLSRDCKKRISDRADKERLTEFNRDKKAWRDEAKRLAAIEFGDANIDDDNAEHTEHTEYTEHTEDEDGLDWIDGTYCIDSTGDDRFK